MRSGSRERFANRRSQEANAEGLWNGRDLTESKKRRIITAVTSIIGHAHAADHLETLASFSQVAAAAFAPLVIGAHPSLFGLDDFGELDRPMDLERDFEHLDYLQWRRLRESEDARFLVVTVPRVLRREPHDFNEASRHEFPYREDVSGPGTDRYLWGPAVYAYAGVLVQSFQNHGWLEDIRGADRGPRGGGLVAGLPTPAFRCDPKRIAPRGSTDLNIDEELDRELRDLGFLPLCHCQGTPFSAFHGVESLQRPAVYDRPIASANARISAQIPVILNVSRFAHYIKIVGHARRPDRQRFSNRASWSRFSASGWLTWITSSANEYGFLGRSGSPLSPQRGPCHGPGTTRQAWKLCLRPPLAAPTPGRKHDRNATAYHGTCRPIERSDSWLISGRPGPTGALCCLPEPRSRFGGTEKECEQNEANHKNAPHLPLSLLDRLINEPLPGDQDPRVALQDGPGSNGNPQSEPRRELARRDLARLRLEAILRDLEVLLNTRRSLVCLPEVPGELSRSVLDYGLAAARGCGPTSEGRRESLRKEIESAIARFEPRLVNVRVALDTESGPLERPRLLIDASLAGAEPGSFQASLESQGSRFALRGDLP